MRLLTASTLAFLVVAVPAQVQPPPPNSPTPTAESLAAAKQRLSNTLQKAAGQVDTAFSVEWGPDQKKGDDTERMLAAIMGQSGFKGKVTGSWHQDRMHLAFEGDEGDELVVAGRRMLARDGKNDWRLRSKRFADGNSIGFTPDVPLLVQLLAGWDLAVTRHDVGAKNDRPVEILSVTLSPEQVAEGVWSGALPEPMVQAPMMGFAMIAGAAGGRQAAAAPAATVDLAVHFDPATSVIHELHFRSWVEEGAMAGGVGGVRIFRAGAAVRVVGGGDDDEKDEAEDEKDVAPEATDAPLRYEHGLPIRPRKKMSVNDFKVELSQHGQRSAPALDALQQKLLGR